MDRLRSRIVQMDSNRPDAVLLVFPELLKAWCLGSYGHQLRPAPASFAPILFSSGPFVTESDE